MTGRTEQIAEWPFCRACNRTHRGAPCGVAAQEGGRGGADTTTAAVEAVLEEVVRFADAICPEGTYDKADKAWRVAGSRRYVASEVRAALSDPVGTLAKHDAEVLRAAARDMYAAEFEGDPVDWLEERADRIEAASTEGSDA